MSNRLNQEREKTLTPVRMQKAINELSTMVFIIGITNDRIDFTFKESKVSYFPYSGWATGKTIKDGRGLKNLLNQMRGKND